MVPQGCRWYAKAQFSMGAAYQTGSGVPQDYVEAVKWFRKAAEQGDAERQSDPGDVYGEGQGYNRTMRRL